MKITKMFMVKMRISQKRSSKVKEPSPREFAVFIDSDSGELGEPW